MRSTGAAPGGHVLRAVTRLQNRALHQAHYRGVFQSEGCCSWALLATGQPADGCRHRSPPRQHQPEKVTVARLETP